MTKKDFKTIIRILSEENKKLRKKIDELQEKADKVDEINEIVGKWYRMEGIESGNQALLEINDVIML